MKRYLFGFLLLCLFLPYFQKLSGIVNLKPLEGAYEKQDYPELTMDGWFDQSYQLNYAQYHSDYLGFRELFIRCYHQMYYTLFHQTKANTCVVGKENQLFLDHYISAYTGADFIGESEINFKIDRLKYIQDYLSFKGIDLITVLAPGKGSFYPEYIPDKYLMDKNANTNYSFYQKGMASLGMNFIDLNDHFKQIKNKTKYPLYPEKGGHWTEYGMYLAMDSIVRYIENKRNIDAPDIVLENVVMSADMRDPDDDIEKIMNLYQTIPTKEMPYVDLSFKTEGKVKPKVLVISDSYFWQAIMKNIPQTVFDFDNSFWYYFNTVALIDKPVSELNLEQEVLKYDVVLLISTDGTLERFPFGVEHRMYDVFRSQDRYVGQKFFRRAMQNNADWYGDIIRKAEENNVTIEQQLDDESNYMAEETIKNLSAEEQEIVAMIHKIKSTPEWFNSVSQKAKELNIHIDLMCYLDAVYVIESQKNKPEN